MTAAAGEEGSVQGAEAEARESKIQDLRAKLSALEDEEKESVAAVAAAVEAAAGAPLAAGLAAGSAVAAPGTDARPRMDAGGFSSEAVAAIISAASFSASSSSSGDEDEDGSGGSGGSGSKAPRRPRGRPRKDPTATGGGGSAAGASLLGVGGGMPPAPPPKPQLPRGLEAGKAVRHPTWGMGTVGTVRQGPEGTVLPGGEEFEVEVEFVIGAVTLPAQEASRLVVVD